MPSSHLPPNKRDWKVYNNALISRAELFLDPKVLKNWEMELRKLNRHKNGRRFIYPKCFIEYLALLKTYFGLSYRALESVMCFLEKHIPILKKPDHSTIQRRIAKMSMDFYSSVRHRKGIIISIDSSGLKVHNRGEWIRHKHRVRRGYLKIHFAVNPKTREIIDLESTTEELHDNRVFRPLLRRIMKRYKVKKVLADAAYDDHRNFNLLDRHKIRAAIKMKKNSFNHKWHPKWDRKHRVRRKHVEIMRSSYKDWKRRFGYGKRWVSEIVFSAFKANFGEYFTSKKMENIKKEIELKAYVHNMLMNHMSKC
jgi:hypothetical protein